MKILCNVLYDNIVYMSANIDHNNINNFFILKNFLHTHI